MRHARLDLSISERFAQLEADMTAVQDAVDQLARKLDQIEQLLTERDATHQAAVTAQIERADGLIAMIKGDNPHEAPESSIDWQEAPPQSGLIG